MNFVKFWQRFCTGNFTFGSWLWYIIKLFRFNLILEKRIARTKWCKNQFDAMSYFLAIWRIKSPKISNYTDQSGSRLFVDSIFIRGSEIIQVTLRTLHTKIHERKVFGIVRAHFHCWKCAIVTMSLRSATHELFNTATYFFFAESWLM